jgi:aspartyl-tRNA(Asn)/glutamyl-tRNA(Gln) amidotransferase subunit C
MHIWSSSETALLNRYIWEFFHFFQSWQNSYKNMKITIDEVKYVAGLSRLELKPGEAEVMAGQLGQILSYVDKLNELDTSEVEPTTHAISITNAFRDDELRESLGQEKALANSPRQNGESFVVPKVI